MPKLLIHDLTPDNDYVVQIRAVESDGHAGAWSPKLDFTTSIDPLAPAPVTSLSWVPSGTSFVATWVAPTTNADGTPLKDFHDYKVQIINFDNTSQSVIYHTTALRFDFTFEQNVAAFGSAKGHLTIKVFAEDTNKVPNISVPTTATAQNPLPNDPTGLTATALIQAYQVSWNANTDLDLDHYDISVGSSTSGPWTIIWAGMATAAVVPTTLLSPQYIRLRAFDVFNQADATPPVFGPISAVSPGVIDTVPPGPPSSVTTTNEATDSRDSSGAHRQIEVDWGITPASDLAGFTISYKSLTDTNWTYLDVPDSTVSSFIIHNLLPVTTYTVRVQEYDFGDNESTPTVASNFTTSRDTTPPNTPAAPTAVGTTNFSSIQVRHSLLDSGGLPMPSDIAYLAVYYSLTSTVVISDATYLGNIPVVPPVASTIVPANGTFSVPAAQRTSGTDTTTTSNTYYVAVVAVDKNGNPSTLSAPASVTVGLISGLNVASATITDANISDLTVTKLTAGTGLLTDLTVFSTLTLGTSLGAGTLVSGDYVPATTGFKLSTGALEINTGSIRAASLLLQDSSNIIPSQYAAFNLSAAFYSSTTLQATNATFGIDGTVFLTGPYTLTVTPTVDGGFVDFTTNRDTDFQAPVQGGNKYIVSMWVYQDSGVGNQVQIRFRDNATGVATSSPKTMIPDSTWTRVSYVATMATGATGAWVGMIFNSGGVQYWVDQVQLEWMSSASTQPSPWRPPSLTVVDGGMIKTGSIQSINSSSFGGVTQPMWSIDTQGSARFANAVVTGSLIIGDPLGGGTLTSQVIQSQNYATGVTGFKVDGTGAAEFNSVVVKGTFATTALTLAIGGVNPGVRVSSTVSDRLNFYTGYDGVHLSPIETDNPYVGTTVSTGTMGIVLSGGSHGATFGVAKIRLEPATTVSDTNDCTVNADFLIVSAAHAVPMYIGGALTDYTGSVVGPTISPANICYYFTDFTNGVHRFQNAQTGTSWARVTCYDLFTEATGHDYLLTDPVKSTTNKPSSLEAVNKIRLGLADNKLHLNHDDVKQHLPHVAVVDDDTDMVSHAQMQNTLVHAIQQLTEENNALAERIKVLETK